MSKTRLSARVAWRIAGVLAVLGREVTWEWLAWWTAALIRFGSTGQTITVTRLPQRKAWRIMDL